jgi:hypothetical protein
MAIKKKEAKMAMAILHQHVTESQLLNAFGALLKSKIKNRSFRKTIKRLANVLEQPKKAATKKAA